MKIMYEVDLGRVYKWSREGCVEGKRKEKHVFTCMVSGVGEISVESRVS